MLDDQQLAQILLSEGTATTQLLEQGMLIARDTKTSLYSTLIERKLIDEEKVILAISTNLNFPCVSLKEFSPNPKIIDLIPAVMAEQFRLMPLGLADDDGERKIYVAMSDPLDLEAIEEVSEHCGFAVVPLLAGPLDLRQAILETYGHQGPLVEVELDDFSVDGQEFDFDDSNLLGSMDDLEILIEGDGGSETMEGDLSSMLGDLDDLGDESDLSPTPPKGLPPLFNRSGQGQGGKKNRPKPSLGGGFNIDFGNIDLSGPRDDGGKDLHNQQTLPSQTKVPDILRMKQTTEISSFEPSESKTPSPPASTDGAMNFSDFNDWSDLDDPEDASSDSAPRRRTEGSGIRYVTDPNLKKRSGKSSFIDSVPTSDLIRAMAKLLIQKGIITERELNGALRGGDGPVKFKSKR